MKYFSHCDVVTAARLNEIVNAINAAETQTGFSSYIIGGRNAVIPGVQYFGHHRKRWLMYRSVGEIYDVNGTPDLETNTQLSDCDEDICVFDLHTVPWLKYGDIYVVEGSEFALESDTDA